jgi:trk system potassium uptake protein TrkA
MASRTVLRAVGALQVLIGGLMSAPVLVSLLFRGDTFERAAVEAAPIAGLSLIDAEGLLPEETVSVAIVRGDALRIPRGESEIRASNTVTLFAKDGANDRITDTFTRS